MKSKILRKHIVNEIIYFESEDLNFFIPYSSKLKTIECNIEDDHSWCSTDPSVSEKPMTVVIDAEADDQGQYTGRVLGFYLFDVNINVLKTFEGDHGYDVSNLEYFVFETPRSDIIARFSEAESDHAFQYIDGYKDRLLDLICG